MRFIDAFVESLDLLELGFSRAEPAQTGRPAYAPADLLKLYIYGYLNRIRALATAGTRVQAQCRSDVADRQTHSRLQNHC